MKVLILILFVLSITNGHANNSCFGTQNVRDLIEASSEIDICFKGSVNTCGLLDRRSPMQQRAINAKRLVPYDRSLDRFMNIATGAIIVKFGKYDGDLSEAEATGSGQKISSCHILTSAHLLYADAKFSLSSNNYQIFFQSGQTCNSRQPFENTAEAEVAFKMVNDGSGNGKPQDFVCDKRDGKGVCTHRLFYAHSDLIILKLKKNTYVKDSNYFRLNVSKPSEHRLGQRVNCWGFPGHNENIPIEESKSNLMLWHQKGAQIFGDRNGKSLLGTLTSGVSYNGMSGGGCSTDSDPTELIGLISKGNKRGGKPVFNVAPDSEFSEYANYLSSFHVLAARYKSEHRFNKTLSQLEEECDAKR